MKGLAFDNDGVENVETETENSDSESSLTVRQMSELTGLSEYNLRYYERVELIGSVSRRANSHRRYSMDDVARIQSLVCLRAVGMPIEEMRHYFEIAEKGAQAAPELQEILNKQRVVLKKRIREMKKSLDYIERKIEYWKAVENGDQSRACDLLQEISRPAKK